MEYLGRASAAPLYNGNIAAMAVNLPITGSAASNTMVYNYHYDQLNRLKQMDAFSGLNLTTQTFAPVQLDDYHERINYDPNGNILNYVRRGMVDGAHTDRGMDSLTYNYWDNTNQLKQVADNPDYTSHFTEDIDNQSSSTNYQYDASGNLIADAGAGISNISWTVYGKIASITNSSGTINYTYDATGNRISKTASGVTTVYVRDAQGNVLSIYEKTASSSLVQKEIDMYGSSRLGVLHSLTVPSAPETMGSITGTLSTFTRGEVNFELANHLGNVLATISDRKLSVSSATDGSLIDHFTADIASAQDYYPFGMQMPGRVYSANSGALYRYGFNGKENDNEVKGVGDQIDYGMRVYDPRLGKFLSIDPLTKKYPWYTPYQFAGNKPIAAIDIDGLEEWFVNNGSGVVIGPYPNQQAAQDAVKAGRAKPQAPKVSPPPQAKPIQEKSTFSEVVGVIHTAWKWITWDPTNPVAAQPTATTPGEQIIEMTAPYLPYEKIGGAIFNKLLPEIPILFKPIEAEGANSSIRALIGEENISVISKHLEQFGERAENTEMLRRMRAIASGDLEATEIDENFMRHELREQELEAGGVEHQTAHEQVLKEQNMYHRDYEQKLYTKEALEKGNAQMEKEATGN